MDMFVYIDGQRVPITLAVAHSSSPYVTIYNRSGDTFTKLSNPGSLPAGTGLSAAWNNGAQT